MPYAHLIFENEKYKLTYDIKSILLVGLALSINKGEFLVSIFGLTFYKKLEDNNESK